MLVHYISGDDGAFSTLCRDHKWKRTSQRRAVFNYLCGNKEHPTVETVWRSVRKNLPDVSLDSVYRILDDFTEAGVIRRLTGAKVIRYDSDTTQHEHYICHCCLTMHDFTCFDVGEVAAACQEFGRIESMELTVTGLCHTCEAARERSRTDSVGMN